MRNSPELSLVAIWTPSTEIGRLGVARPSSLSLVPLTSARETLTAACAGGARAAQRMETNARAIASRNLRPVTMPPDRAPGRALVHDDAR